MDVHFVILQMEFENWEVSPTMRDLVRQENVKYELSLLAIQQEKVSVNNSNRLSINKLKRILTGGFCSKKRLKIKI